MPIKVSAGKGQPEVEIAEDDEFKKLKADKVATLKPAFQKVNGAFSPPPSPLPLFARSSLLR